MKLQYIGRFSSVQVRGYKKEIKRGGEPFDFPDAIAESLLKQVHRVSTGKTDKDGNPTFNELPQWKIADGEKVGAIPKVKNKPKKD